MAGFLEPAAQHALQVKREYKRSINAEARALALAPAEGASLEANLFDFAGFDTYPVGAFENLDSIRLRWAGPDLFEFIPEATKPFRFVRSTREAVEPRRMFTDGGSIPQLLRAAAALSPWGYAPAYLVHDWQFDLQYCRRGRHSFEEVRDIMMEGVKTLMVSGVCPQDKLAFQLLYAGINSPVARSLWDAPEQGCPLPPDV